MAMEKYLGKMWVAAMSMISHLGESNLKKTLFFVFPPSADVGGGGEEGEDKDD